MNYSKLFSILLIILLPTACSRDRASDLLQEDIYLEPEFISEVSYDGSLSSMKDIVFKCDMSVILTDIMNQVQHDPDDYPKTEVSFSWTVDVLFFRKNGRGVYSDLPDIGDHYSVNTKALEWEDTMSLQEITGNQSNTFWEGLLSETEKIACTIKCICNYSWADDDSQEPLIWSKSVDEEHIFIIE